MEAPKREIVLDYKEAIAGLDLRALVAPGKKCSGERPVLVSCWWHQDSHGSLAVYRDHLYCYGCQKRLSALDWIAEQEKLDIQREFKKVVEAAARYGRGGIAVASPPTQPAPRKETLGPMDVEAAHRCYGRLGAKRQWYLDRGLSNDTIDSQFLGHDGRAFTIPVWHPSGQLLAVRFRRDDALGASGPKYWGIEGRNETLLYNQAALKGVGSVVITEGELDCLLLWQEGIAAVSSTNGTGGMVNLWPKVERHFRCWRIVLALDQDEGGNRAAEELKTMICGANRRSANWSRAVILRWDAGLGKDITELASRMGIQYVLDLVRRAQCLKQLSKV